MRICFLSGIALGLMASVASAEPVKLTDQQMNATAAGVLSLGDINVGVNVANQIPTNVAAQVGLATALKLFSESDATAVVSQVLNQTNLIGLPGGNG